MLTRGPWPWNRRCLIRMQRYFPQDIWNQLAIIQIVLFFQVIVFERATGRCLSGSNAPTVSNLKQWLKQNPGFEVVSSSNKVNHK